MANEAPSVLLERTTGTRPNGEVTLRDFDRGIVETLGATVVDDAYYVNVDGVTPPPGQPGIPVIFMNPEDYFANFRYPSFVVTRDDISISTTRLHPFQQQYRAPAPTAQPVVVQTPTGPRTYYNRVIQREQATPYDITYTVNIYNSLRGGTGGRYAANAMLTHVLQVCPVYGQVFVRDSLNNVRTYELFNEGISNLDDTAGVSERTIQFAVTLRVEAEYDLLPVTSAPTVQSRKQSVRPKR